jgi:hypothetical protein
MAGSKTAFDMSKMAIGGIGQMLDSVEFVKRAWSTLNIPSTLVPTVDIEELDKRIADLKAVEQWLNVNLSMLHGTIQGLEIQRGTLAAVKAFGSTLGTLPMAAAEGVAARVKPAARPAPAPAPAPEAAEPAAPARKGTAASAATVPLAGINPTAWWNLLQQNFNQVAEAAMSGGGLQNAAVNAMKVAGSAAGAVAKAAAAPKPARAPAKRAPAKRKRAPAKPRAPKATP